MPGIPRSWGKKTAPVAASKPLPSSPMPSLPPRASQPTGYGQSRVLDRSQLRYVENIETAKEFAAERGDTTTGDKEFTDPGYITSSRNDVDVSSPKTNDFTKLALAAFLGYMLFGG